MSELKSWSGTAGSNNSASPNGFPEGMAPSGVNDSAREVMAALARYRTDVDGVTATTGSANAYAFDSATTYTAYATGDKFVFRANFSNTGAATFNVDSLGTKAIQHNGLALTGYEIISGGLYIVTYDGTQFQLANPTPKVVQKSVTVDVTEYSTNDVTFPIDNTIPQNTEGVSLRTFSFTPRYANSRIFIRITGAFTCSTLTATGFALFTAASANAIAATLVHSPAANDVGHLVFEHDMASPGTSAITYTIRWGHTAAGTTYLSSAGASSVFSTVGPAMVISVEEYF